MAVRAASSWASARAAWSSRIRPAWVGKARLPTRSSTGVPRSSSSRRMWWLSAGWLRCSDSAARENEPCRVISASVRRWAGVRAMAEAKYIESSAFKRFIGLLGLHGRMLDGMSDLSIRAAHAADAEAIAAIYNEGIEDRVATLETELRTPDERRAWLAARGERHPVLVAERGGAVLAWASLNPSIRAPPTLTWPTCRSTWRAARAAPAWGASCSPAIIDEARGLGFHKMVLAAFPSNTAGMRLYARMGFTTVGTYREQGCLDGRWVDVIVMEQILG